MQNPAVTASLQVMLVSRQVLQHTDQVAPDDLLASLLAAKEGARLKPSPGSGASVLVNLAWKLFPEACLEVYYTGCQARLAGPAFAHGSLV